jgi:uncharacterized membrane protein
MTDEDRDLRDRLIRLEEKMLNTNAKVDGNDRKMWAVIALVLVAVGKRLIEVIGLVP